LIAEVTRGTSLDPAKVTLREYLERWLSHTETVVSPRSSECYRETVEYWIVPALGNVPLAKLTPEQLAQAYADALARGGSRGVGLSPVTVGMMHRVLIIALKQAVVWKLLASSPAAFVKPPRMERKPMKVLDVDHTAALIEFARGRPRMFMPVLFFVLTGVRRAEVAAIRWNQLDLTAGRLSVSASIEQTRQGTREKPPKSGRPRAITLPSLLVEELRRHKLRQAEDLLALGVRQTNETHVCLRQDDIPWTPHALTDAMRRLIRASGVPHVRPCHGLRHGHATHLLQKNTHVKIVSERLGHANIQLTLNTYSHVLPSMQEEAADNIDDAIREALTRGPVAKR